MGRCVALRSPRPTSLPECAHPPTLAAWAPLSRGAGEGLMAPLGFLALAQIVVGGARQRARWAGERLRLLALELHDDSAIGAHLHQPHPILALEHRMPAGELLDDPLDRALDPERLAAIDAVKGRLFLQHDRAEPGWREIEPRHQADHLLGTGCPAQPALHAGRLVEAKLPGFRIIRQRPGRAGADAGE